MVQYMFWRMNEATTSRGLPAFAKVAVLVHEGKGKE